MRILLIISLFISYLAQAQTDTLQVDLKEVSPEGKVTIASSVVATIAGKLSMADSATFATKANRQKLADSVNVLLAGKLATNGNGSSLTGLTKTQVGLANADNTSDASKPISTATQTALNNKSTIYFGLDASANDSYSITASPVPGSYTQGMVVIFRAQTANTTGCTINVNGLGAVNIVKRVSTTMATGDILALQFCMLVYNGTAFVIMNPVVN